jgi:hypothetical protein
MRGRHLLTKTISNNAVTETLCGFEALGQYEKLEIPSQLIQTSLGYLLGSKPDQYIHSEQLQCGDERVSSSRSED